MHETFKSFQQKLSRYVDGDADSIFEYFIIAVIIINSICLGIETSSEISENFRSALNITDQICLLIFIVELILKFAAFGRNFFSNWWNTFDLIIVLFSIFGEIPFFSIFRGLKIFRASRIIKTFRTFRFVKSLKIINSLNQLQRILSAITKAIPSIIWTFVLLLLVFYFYAIIGVNIFGTEFDETFGSIGKTFYTLFQLMLFDDWGNITRPVLKEHSLAWIYFVSFGIISAYTILQVVTGIVVDSIQNVAKEQAEEIAESDENKNQKIAGSQCGRQRLSASPAITESESPQVTLESLSAQIAELQKKVEELKKGI